MICNLLFIILFVIFMFCVIRERLNLQHYPPGPFSWPYIGNFVTLRRLTKECKGQHFALMKLSKIYNSNVIGFNHNGKNVIAVSGREAVHAVLHGDEYEGRPWNEFIKLRNFGLRKGITMNDGENWRLIRGWFVKNFRNVGFGREEMSELIKFELMQILENFKKGGVVRIKTAFAPVVINVLWSLAIGKRFCEGNKYAYSRITT